jgi:hypothetical protein
LCLLQPARLLEIELDGIFKTLLLLKKKKYAAVKLEPDAGGRLAEVRQAGTACLYLPASRLASTMVQPVHRPS